MNVRVPIPLDSPLRRSTSLSGRAVRQSLVSARRQVAEPDEPRPFGPLLTATGGMVTFCSLSSP
jgi:hypothetical protein